jgi:hypothetical protein
MSKNETESPYWQIPKENSPVQGSYRYDETEGKVILFTAKHDESGYILLQQAWNNCGERTEEALKQVQSGLKSPLYYQMEKIGMELSSLAASVLLPQWRVNRHFKPRVYKKLKRGMLERYANAFDLKIEDLDKID